MQALLPIAGKSSRMAKKFSGPKQLLPVAGRPLIEWVLEGLPKNIDEIVLVVGGPYEQDIRNYFHTEHHGRKVTYVRQKEPLGLGHAIQQARGTMRGKFLVSLPDDIFAPKDLEKMTSMNELCVLVYRRPDPENFGVVVSDEEGRITRMVEKPKEFVSDRIAAGSYVLDEEVFEIEGVPSARGEIELPDLINALVQTRGRIMYTVDATFWIPVNDPTQLNNAEQIMKDRGGSI